MLGSLWDTYREGPQWRDTLDRYRLDKLKGKKKIEVPIKFTV